MTLAFQKPILIDDLFNIFKNITDVERTHTEGATDFTEAINTFVTGIEDSDVTAEAQSSGLGSVSTGTVRSQIGELLGIVGGGTPGVINHVDLLNIGTNTHALIDTHIADLTLHFTEASIDHAAILNIGTNTHIQIDSHIVDATLHFTEVSIDHTAILNIGTNTHAQIDTHILDGTIHFTEASIDHAAILNVGSNTHAAIDTHVADATLHFTEASIDHTAILNIGTFSHAEIDITLAEMYAGIVETIDITVDASGANIEFQLQGDGATDLNIVTSSGIVTVDTTPALTVNLTAGTTTVPQINYVYLDNSYVLTASTAGWPSGVFHAPIAVVLVLDKASTNTNGALKVHAYTDHLSSDVGHVVHIGKKIRALAATWTSGVSITPTPAVSGSGANVSFATTLGVVFQMHPHAMPALDSSTDGIHVVNHNTTPFVSVTDLSTQVLDSAGASLTNKHYNVVIWGVVSEKDGECHLMCNLPSGSYDTEPQAIADVSKYTGYAIPFDFRGVGFLIAEARLRNVADTTWTMNAVTDLRGLDAASTAGGGPGITDHGSLSGLADDDHAGHPWLIGRSAGQILIGGTASGDDLVLKSTSNATKGNIDIQESTFVFTGTAGSWTTALADSALTQTGTGVVALTGNLQPEGGITSSATSLWEMAANSASLQVLTIDASNAGAGEGQLFLSADDKITLFDSTGALILDAGALSESGLVSVVLQPDSSIFLRGGGISWYGDQTGYFTFSGSGVVAETGMVSVDLTPSGAMTLQGGGISKFGDDVGYWSFDGAGALTETGITSAIITPSGVMTLTSGDAATWGMAASDAAAKTFTIDSSNAVGLAYLTLSADNRVNINDGTCNLRFNAGGLSETGMTTLSLTPSGTTTIQGGGSTIIGDTTGYFTFSSGAVTEAGMTNFTVTPSATLTLRGGTSSKFGDDTGYWAFNGTGWVDGLGMAQLSVLPSGAMILKGGGASQFGDTTGYLTFSGAGAVAETGMTSLNLSPSGAITLSSLAQIDLNADTSSTWTIAANNAADQTLSIISTNVGAGAGLLQITSDRVRIDDLLGINCDPAFALDIVNATNPQIRLSQITTNNATKVGSIGVRHYAVANDEVGLFLATSGASDNLMTIGGGTSTMYAVTNIGFYTAATTTTFTGTLAGSIFDDGYWRIGNSGSATSIATPGIGDFLITSELEVDGVIWADGGITTKVTSAWQMDANSASSLTLTISAANAGAGFGHLTLSADNNLNLTSGGGVVDMTVTSGKVRLADNTLHSYGASSDASFEWDTGQTNDSLLLGLGNTSRTFIITETADLATNFAHTNQTNPTLFIQSADATTIADWLSLAHNQTDAVIATGAGGLSILAVTNVEIGSGTPTVAVGAGDLYVTDALEVDGVVQFDGIVTFASTTSGVDHVDLDNKGTNTHAQIDTHIADATMHTSVSRPSGWLYTYDTAAQIQVDPIGLGVNGCVPVHDGSGDLQIIRSSSTFNPTLASQGAGGRHDDYSVTESANQLYVLYAIWGTTPGLEWLWVEDGDIIVDGISGVNEVSIDDVTGGTYTHWSRVSCFVRNDGSSNIKKFRQAWEGAFQYIDFQTADRILSALTSTTATALDFSGWAPAADTGAIIPRLATSATEPDNVWLAIWADSGKADDVFQWTHAMGDAAGYTRDNSYYGPTLAFSGFSLATSYYTAWSSTITGGSGAFVNAGIVELS